MLGFNHAEVRMTGATVKQHQNSVRGYLGAHWRGALPLALSFWINLILVRITVLLAAPLTHPPVLKSSSIAIATCLLFILVAHGGVFVWQVVGVLRASDRYQRIDGNMIPAYGVYFGIAVCLLFTLSSAFTALQTSFIAPPTFSLGLDLARERAGRYALRLEGSTLYFEGSFERGATAKLETLLGDQPGVTKIVLTSSGGNIFEGRGVGKVIAANNLATHVTGDCFSACTRAYIAGRVRTVAPDARLGFHRYRIDAAYPIPFADIDTEQQRDRAYFRSRGVDEAFLARMHDAVPPNLWLPASQVLLAAGVAHRISTDPQ